MPRVRDVAWAQTTVATGTTLGLRVPSFQQNDLLLAAIVSDTGPSAWTPPVGGGWNQMLDVTNTAQLTVFWKIASASEADPTFTRALQESFNGVIVSIEDVNTTTPFGSPIASSSVNRASAAKFLLPRITGSVNNSLVMHFVANSATGVPSLIEGGVHGLVGADGVAESIGVGWSFNPTSGSLSLAASASNVAAGAGVNFTVQVAPPSGGAQIIPVYTAFDNSVYLDPINGTTAFNGNTGLAATADTNFGTNIAEITTNDATVAAQADAGINSFHSVGQLTSATTANQMSGAELVFAVANRPDLSSKNLLIHGSPSTTGQLQRLTSIQSGRGLWIGIRGANAASQRVWQVYGQELGVGQFHQPLVVHPAASASVFSSGSNPSSSVQAVGMWVGTNVATATVWRFYQMWGLDTVGLVGGNATYPMGIAEIVAASAEAHERKSTLLQGTNQLISYQPIQIGNSGVNQTYLKLDSTAIEFPTLYNRATKNVTYNSIPNFVGLSYNPGASDTIIHKNSVVSSNSRYRWGLHPSASVSASYDFDGLSVIGAGIISLNRGINITGLTINNYESIDASNVRLYSSIITNVPTSSNSVTLNTSSLLDGCTINVTNVSASNSWTSVPTPQIFQNTTFIGSQSSGHAIRLTSPGSYTLTGLTFTGFGSGSTNSSAIFNDSGGAVTMSIAGGGTVDPSVRNGVGASTLIVAGQTTVTLTGLVDNSEVRILLAGTTTDVTGIENTSGSMGGQYSFTTSQGTLVDIVVHNLDYQFYRLDGYTVPSSDATLPIQQVFDRNYSNP